MDSPKIKQVFDLLDTEKSSVINIKELPKGLRATGLNPSESEIRILLSEANSTNDGDLIFSEFKKLCKRCQEVSQTNKGDVLKYFKSFDTEDTGFLDSVQLKASLLADGERLEGHEVDAVLQDFAEDNGQVNIDKLLEGLFK